MGNWSGIGDDLLRIAGIMPGGGGWWTWEARLEAEPGEDPYTSPEEYAWKSTSKTIQLATKYGWRVVQVNSAGDRAIAETLALYEKAREDRVVRSQDQMLRIDHTVILRDEDIPKLKELGVLTPSISFRRFESVESLVTAWGEKRAHEMFKVKSLIEGGLKPVIGMGDACPFWNLEFAVTRTGSEGRVLGPDEKVTRQEALWMVTSWAASYLGEQDRLGTIEPGKLADLVILDGDYLTVPEDEISELAVSMTILGGEIVYDAGPGGGAPCTTVFPTREASD